MLSLSRLRPGEYLASFIKNDPNQYDPDIRINDLQLHGTAGTPRPRHSVSQGSRGQRRHAVYMSSTLYPRPQRTEAPTPSVPTGVLARAGGRAQPGRKHKGLLGADHVCLLVSPSGGGTGKQMCSVGEDSVNHTLRCTFLYVN